MLCSLPCPLVSVVFLIETSTVAASTLTWNINYAIVLVSHGRVMASVIIGRIGERKPRVKKQIMEVYDKDGCDDVEDNCGEAEGGIQSIKLISEYLPLSEMTQTPHCVPQQLRVLPLCGQTDVGYFICSIRHGIIAIITRPNHQTFLDDSRIIVTLLLRLPVFCSPQSMLDTSGLTIRLKKYSKSPKEVQFCEQGANS